MAIDVYACARGGKCVNMFRYTHAGIREMRMQERWGAGAEYHFQEI